MKLPMVMPVAFDYKDARARYMEVTGATLEVADEVLVRASSLAISFTFAVESVRLAREAAGGGVLPPEIVGLALALTAVKTVPNLRELTELPVYDPELLIDVASRFQNIELPAPSPAEGEVPLPSKEEMH